MKERMLVLGDGTLGEQVLELVRDQYDCGYIDDIHSKGEEVAGVPVVGSTDELLILNYKYSKVLIAAENEELREELYNLAKLGDYSFPSYMGPDVHMDDGVSHGQGCIFLGGAHLKEGTQLGDFVIAADGAVIEEGSRLKSFESVW